MRVIRTARGLLVKDRLLGVWLFSLIFLVGGAVTFACPLGLCIDAESTFGVKEIAPLLLGALTFLAGAAMIAASPRIVSEFDETSMTVTIHFLGLKRSSRTVPFGDVSGVVILEIEGTEGYGYELALRTIDNESITLSHTWSAKRPIEKAAVAIETVITRYRAPDSSD